MQITNVSQNRSQKNIKRQSSQRNDIAFKAAYIPTTAKYSASVINSGLERFNNQVLGQILPKAIEKANQAIKTVHKALGITNPRIKDASDFAQNFNCFVLAGGPGSRFAELSNAVGHMNGEIYNKICTPFATGNGHPPFTMITPALALKAVFAAGEKAGDKAGKDFGYKPYTINEERGNFWHIIKHYMNPENEIKDTVLVSGDNAFDIKSEEMLETIIKMKETGQHLAMFGVKKTPEEVANKFGTVGVQKSHFDYGEDTMALNAFVEKPPIDVARKMAETSDGINIANTGAIVISKEAMTAIVETAKKDEALRNNVFEIIKGHGDGATEGMKKMLNTGNGLTGTFSRSEKESDRFDFSTVQAWILKNMYSPQQVAEGKGPIVKMIDSSKWSDVGEPTAMYDMLDGVAKEGKFLQNFPEKMAKGIQEGLRNNLRLDFKSGAPAILVTNRHYPTLKEVPAEVIKRATPVEGVRIVG